MTNGPKKIIIMGAAGRDFHNFNVCLRDNPDYEVVAFTAAQIPYITGRCYPANLAGKLYPKGIPIYPEEDLADLIKKEKIDEVIFAYSDVPYPDLMRKAALVLACGANFKLLSPAVTMIKSKRPVIAICAVRTGCGKSPTTRYIADILTKMNKKIVIIRHPMPYGDLEKQAAQRFASIKDLDKHQCTIEEREDYEPHLEKGFVLYAGVDYRKILEAAEKEAEIILWDGGNNDFSFYKPDLTITLTDPFRPGHELAYYPGEICLRMADVALINKVNTAKKEDVEQVRQNIKNTVPKAKIILTDSKVTVENPMLIKNKKALVIEDGPTVTHGGVKLGAGLIAAKQYKAKIISPKPYLVGSLKEVFAKYSHLDNILPAMGYRPRQIRELEETINKSPAEIIISATPTDLTRIIKVNKPVIKVQYELEEKTGNLEKIIKDFVKEFKV